MKFICLALCALGLAAAAQLKLEDSHPVTPICTLTKTDDKVVSSCDVSYGGNSLSQIETRVADLEAWKTTVETALTQVSYNSDKTVQLADCNVLAGASADRQYCDGSNIFTVSGSWHSQQLNTNFNDASGLTGKCGVSNFDNCLAIHPDNNDVLGFLTWDIEALCPRAQYPMRKVSFTAGMNSQGSNRGMTIRAYIGDAPTYVWSTTSAQSEDVRKTIRIPDLAGMTFKISAESDGAHSGDHGFLGDPVLQCSTAVPATKSVDMALCNVDDSRIGENFQSCVDSPVFVKGGTLHSMQIDTNFYGQGSCGLTDTSSRCLGIHAANNDVDGSAEWDIEALCPVNQFPERTVKMKFGVGSDPSHGADCSNGMRFRAQVNGATQFTTDEDQSQTTEKSFVIPATSSATFKVIVNSLGSHGCDHGFMQNPRVICSQA